MSGSTIGGVVGAVVGAYFGNPQLGWMIGSAIGGYVDPEQISGPRLQDARVQTSRDGIAIPFGWGTFPLAGNVIAQGPVIEVKKKERQGKGGPEVTSYTYTRTYAIGLCEGPIAGILQVKRNGKVVYDARTDDAIAEEVSRDGSFAGDAIARIVTQIRAANAKWSNKATFYLGDETQMPDPALEAIFGAGNVPAHRGLAYFVVEDDDVTDLAGAIPQYEVVVASCGDTSQFNGAGIYWNANDRSYVEGDYGVDLADGSRTAWPWDVTESFGTSQIVGVRGTIYRSGGSRYFEVEILGDVSVWEAPLADVCVGVGRLGSDFLNATNNNDSAYVTYFNPNTLAFKCGESSSAENHVLSSGDRIGVLVEFDGAQVPVVWMSYNGTWIRNPPTVPGGIFAGAAGSELPAGSYAPLFFMGVNYTQTQSAPLVKLHQFDEELLYKPVSVPSWGEGGIGTPAPDADGWYILPDGTLVGEGTSSGIVAPCSGIPLSTIVASVCERRGIVASERDVSQLTDLVTGFVVGRETDAASIIQSLAPAYFFDPGEWDAKLRFIKRGGTAVGAINGDDLVERDGDAFERERAQEAELLRRVTVGYNDPQAAYSITTQKWERRAGTVQALGEASVELPLTLDADDAATIAKRRGLVAWGEPEKQKFSLPYRLGKYTPTDIITYTDDDGLVHTIRLMDLQDDSGVRYVESSMNSAEAYGATATGVVPRPPSITEPTLRGPTLLAVMDLPLWRSGDADTLGLYVAGCGYLAGWQGAQVDVSTDGGVSYVEAAQVTVPATIGTTTTALAEWASSEYPSAQSVTVTLPDAPESVSYEALLRYNNRAAIQLDSGEWGVLQYQAVVANGGNSYTLSGLLRGRYATTSGAASAGARFVLLDAAVQFVPVERHLLGDTLKVRATTYGTSSDAAVASDFDFTAGASQTEWPVHGVTATRDVSDNVTVTWIGRARLGVETAPYHSTNFAGYRVSWDDGVTVATADTTATSYTITAAASPVGVTVTPLNTITGAGPASEAITV